MAQVFLSLGSNEDRRFHIQSCLTALKQAFGSLLLSSVYESESVGFKGDAFLNMVVAIDTELAVGPLSKALKSIEDEHGRRRDVPKFSGRTLDIDILTYDDAVGDFGGVVLPRDEITNNAFVLKPLAEIAGEQLHPVLMQGYAVLWQAYDRDQKLWSIDFEWQGQVISTAE